MSKGAGLHPKANSKTKSKTSALAKVQRLTLFGSPQLLEGEDAGAYDELLSRVSAAAKLPKELDNIERIDRLTAIAETRRNAMLREIDRRRAVLGETLRRNVQAVEGEFEVIEKTSAEAKSAA